MSGGFNRLQGGESLLTPSFDCDEKRQRVVSVERIGEEQFYKTNIAQLERHRFLLAEPCSQGCFACLSDCERPPSAPAEGLRLALN